MKQDNPNVYSNKDITVTYDPKTCINAERCARELSEVFRTSVIPWIKLDGTDNVEKIVQQVKRCPSGALQCSKNNLHVEKNTKTKLAS